MIEVSIDYLAGFIDGEGCFNIGRSHQRVYAVKIIIANTDYSILSVIGMTLAKHEIAFKTYFSSRSGSTSKDVYELVILREGCIKKLCCLLEDKLVIKNKQCSIMYQFVKAKEKMHSSGSKGFTDADLEKLDLYYYCMKALNRKGR